MINFFFSFRGL